MEVVLAEWIELEDAPEEIRPPGNLLYATRPREATGTDGFSYVIKGPDLRVVFAEAAGYQLAQAAGLDVPDWALWRDRDEGRIYFASRKLSIRIAADVLYGGGGVENPELVSTACVVDVWLVNRDRNVNNIVARPAAVAGHSRLVAIDFERSEALRGLENRFSLTAIHPRECRPNDALSPIGRDMDAERACCDRIRASCGVQVAGILERLRMDLDLAPIDWIETSIGVLEHRAAHIHRLVAEAWA